MRTRATEVKMRPKGYDWHRYNGLKVKAFAELIGASPDEVKRAISLGWFSEEGNPPELMNFHPGDYYPRWSISPAAVSSYRRGKVMARLREARAQTRLKWEQGVYVIRTEEGLRRYKIGFASNPAQRLQGLQGMSPVALRMVAFLYGRTMKTERALHRVFRERRLHGEWFEESPALLWLCEKHAYTETR